MQNKSFGFIGGGRIVRIFLQAMRQRKIYPNSVVVSDSNRQLTEALKTTFPEINIKIGTNKEAAAQDWVFLAVHPPVFKEVLPEIASEVKNAAAVISLAPVLTAEKMTGMLGGFEKIARMIPNAAAYLNKGFNPVWYSNQIAAPEKKSLQEFFKILGDCPEVAEDKLEAYAIITAMGPTYLWPQLNELHKLSLEFGLTEEETATGIQAMVQNTIDLLYTAGLNYDQVVDLIPVKPLAESEKEFRDIYRTKLSSLYNKLKGK